MDQNIYMRMQLAEQRALFMQNQNAELMAMVQEQAKILSAIGEKIGYDVVLTHTTEAGSEVYEYEKNDEQAESGDYTNPIKWEGQEVTEGLWYWIDEEDAGRDLPHEAISTGCPASFYDKNYFDFVE